MPVYIRIGEVPRKRHIRLPRDPETSFLHEGLAYEHVVTTAGFDRAYSILYHIRPPTRVLASITREGTPLCWRRYAQTKPATPAPTITTLGGSQAQSHCARSGVIAAPAVAVTAVRRKRRRLQAASSRRSRPSLVLPPVRSR